MYHEETGPKECPGKYLQFLVGEESAQVGDVP